MKKIFLVWLMTFAATGVTGSGLPDNIYFKAMKDEMMRSLKYLHEDGSPQINFMSYKMQKVKPLFLVESSLGSFYPKQTYDQGEFALWTTVSVGNNQQDSLGMDSNFKVKPSSFSRVPESYDGIRQYLWQATSDAYFQALDLYQQKQTYKQLKGIKEDLPDVVPAQQSNYVEQLGEYIPAANYAPFQDVLSRLTEKGNQYPYINQFYINVSGFQKNQFYLNSNGAFYQTNQEYLRVAIQIAYTTKTGFRKQISSTLMLPLYEENFEEKVTQETEKLIEEVKNAYGAVKGKRYVGPVLLKPRATAYLLGDAFLQNVTKLTALRSLYQEEDSSAGILQESVGQPVLSKKINIYDRPKLGLFDGFVTAGFTPIDDEGVAAEDLVLVQNGVLKSLPTSTRPFAADIKSNGHARGNRSNEPREALTNVIMEIEDGLSEEELEEALLQRCRESNLEYCYIIPQLPTGDQDDWPLVRIYTQDGHKEYVYGLIARDYDLRTLRKDVVTGGVFKEMHNFRLPVDTSIIAPSLLLDDMSLQVSKKRPDRPPFLPKP